LMTWPVRPRKPREVNALHHHHHHQRFPP
jgi:hypothetical protein